VTSAALVLAAGIFFYRSTAPLFTGGTSPAVPLVALMTAAAIGLWCGQDYPAHGWLLGLTAAAACAGGVFVSFHGALPQASVAVFGALALVGARLVARHPWPLWLGLLVVAVTALYQGHHAGMILRQDATLPVADAVGMGVLLAAVFFVCFRSVSYGDQVGRPPLTVAGILFMGLAVLWQLAAYRDWVRGPVAADLAMGLARLPVLAMVLVIAAWIAWPRRRRFASQTDRGSASAHWALLALAFFVVPLGTLRIDIPFHTPDAPSAAEAARVLDTLLTDTYLAFNLPSEDAAFDRLAQNLSQDLVADVYLDSRRRLTAGTREGAEVTVRDVSVMEVEDALATVDNAFTYPCQWVVTARVRHLQHIHNRQNVYAGTLTIRVEDDRWKIAALDLLDEKRVVLSWRSS
jgi:hydrogenase/urease accessory protein HupE